MKYKRRLAHFGTETYKIIYVACSEGERIVLREQLASVTLHRRFIGTQLDLAVLHDWIISHDTSRQTELLVP
jgi:hypothetical protein